MYRVEHQEHQEDQVQGQFNKDGISISSSFLNRFQVLVFLFTLLWSAYHSGLIPSYRVASHSHFVPQVCIYCQGLKSFLNKCRMLLSNIPKLMTRLENGADIGKHWQTKPSTLSKLSLHVQQAGAGEES